MQASIFLQRHELPFLLAVLFSGLLYQLRVTMVTNGGTDIVVADVPKTLVFLRGENPYLRDQWAAPYPPFYFLVLGSLVWASSLGPDVNFQTGFWTLRLELVAAHVLLAAFAYLVLRATGVEGAARLAVPGLFLFLPAFSHIGEAWFHGDVFGVLLVGGSLLLFGRGRWVLGFVLLGLASSFKVHPFLALPLLILWSLRWKKHTFRTVMALLLPFVLLTLLPLWFLPGYSQALIGFNTSSRPSWSFTLFVLFYTLLPTYGLTFSTLLINQVWVLVTALLFAAVAVVTWRYGLFLSAVDVVVLGIAVWLLPLRQMYPFYVLWVLVPFALRGRLRETLLVLAPYEVTSDVTSYLWGQYPGWNMSVEPLMIFFSLLSTALISISIAGCIIFVWRGARARALEGPDRVWSRGKRETLVI